MPMPFFQKAVEEVLTSGHARLVRRLDVNLGTTTDLFGNIFLAGYTGGMLTDTSNAGGLDAF